MANNHVAVFAFPFGSHGTPLLNIVRKLGNLLLLPSNNHTNVKFSFFSTARDLKLLSISTGSESDIIRCFEIGDGKPEGYVGVSLVEEIRLFLEAASSPGLGSLREAVAAAEAEVGLKVTCVMGDAFLWFLGDLSKVIGVPWVSCWVSGEHSLSVHLYTHLIRQRFGNQKVEEGREEETLEWIPGLSKIRIKDIPEGVVTGDLESSFSNMLDNMGRVINGAEALCISSCEEMDPVVTGDLKSKFFKVLCIGPLNLINIMVDKDKEEKDTYGCLEWLDKREPGSVVYLGFGSACTPTPTETLALTQALQATNLYFLWSIKDHFKVHFPDEFLEKNRERGLVVAWVPQKKVLAHKAVGVFITHFGYNSMTESIAAQVPMIGRPFFGDHKLNGRLVEAVWGVGLQVEDGVFTKEGVIQSLATILWTQKGKEMRQNLTNLSHLVTTAVSPNGSSNLNFQILFDLVTK